MTSLCRHLSAQEIVNWVTTADGCVHTADADATKQFRPVGVGGVYWALETSRDARSCILMLAVLGPVTQLKFNLPRLRVGDVANFRRFSI